MVQFEVLSGQRRGAVAMARRFPWRIGRAARADLRLEESGIWDQHLTLKLDPAEGFRLSLCPEALATVNGVPFKEITLRNGDLIEVGPVKLRFWLAEPRRSGLRGREWFTWCLLLAVSGAQVALVYWLQQ
jgi:pSer/pThr/pTyr-binding forkhead associated (FHA) protein